MKRIFQLATGLGLITAGLCSEGKKTPYLPVLGPAPLRFETGATDAKEKYTMRPLKLNDEPLEEPVKPPVMAKKDPAEALSTNQPAVKPVVVAAAVVPAPKEEPATSAPPAEVHSELQLPEGTNSPTLTPQMLLHFFNKQASNGPAPGPDAILALPIKPAQAPPPVQSSTATYTSK